MVSIEVSKKVEDDGREFTWLIVTVGDESKSVAMDLNKFSTKRDFATAMRTFAALLDQPAA